MLERMIESDIGRLRVSAWIRWMRARILVASLLTTNASAIAGAITVTSPDHAQTFAYGEMIWHELYLQRSASELAARITFSNLPYAGDDEPRRDESFDFRFPGVQFDPARRAFFAGGRHRQLLPIARFRDDPSFGWVDLAPGAKIYLLKESGRVTAILTATDYPRAGIRWVQMDNNFSLQNLLLALFRELRVRPDG
jgi:hypothetical protein